MVRLLLVPVTAILLSLTPGPTVAATPGAAEPACLAAIRKALPGQVTTSRLQGKSVGRKRLLFRRGGMVLVIDHDVLETTARAFLTAHGADRFPEEVRLLKVFAEKLRKADEVEADPLLRNLAERSRLDFRLAEVLERGGFQLRPARKPAHGPTPGVILRLRYQVDDGELAGYGGRVFVSETCERLVGVSDWVS